MFIDYFSVVKSGSLTEMLFPFFTFDFSTSLKSLGNLSNIYGVNGIVFGLVRSIELASQSISGLVDDPVDGCIFSVKPIFGVSAFSK